MFMIGYGVLRFLAEFFREPDHGIFGLSYVVSMGQWLSLPMVLFGLWLLLVLRKVLANIVKDATPPPGRPHPLQESTIADIRDLFGLIAERERELADEAGRTAKEQPLYPDQPRPAKPVAVTRLQARPRKPRSEN
jgi:hypothetical protein